MRRKESLHQTDRSTRGQLRLPQKRQESSLCPREEQKTRILREKQEGKLTEQYPLKICVHNTAIGFDCLNIVHK